MKKGIVTMNWVTICSPLENGGLKIINLLHENNAYLLKLAWDFAYSNRPWSFLLKSRVLKSKYEFRMVYRSLSLWPEIKQFYSTILDYTSWTVGTSTFINFWNDKWCCTTSLANTAGLSDGPTFQIQSLSFGQVVIGIFPCLYSRCLVSFNHIMVREEQDISNWILDESGCFTLKSARTFFLEPRVSRGCGKFIWSFSIPPSKTLLF